MIDGERKPFRHHADDFVFRTGQVQRLADDVRVRAIARLPDLETDHGYRESVGALVVIGQRTAEQRRHPRRAKARGRHLGHIDCLFDVSGGRSGPPLHCRERAKVFHGAQRLPPPLELRNTRPNPALTLGIPDRQPDETLAFIQRHGAF